MLKRSIKITFRLNAQECQRLKKQVKKSGLSQEAFIRTLINGYVPKELPPPDYYAMMRELHAIGSNLNQIAAKANATGHIDRTVFQYEANRLRKAVLDIQAAVTSPESAYFGQTGHRFRFKLDSDSGSNWTDRSEATYQKISLWNQYHRMVN